MKSLTFRLNKIGILIRSPGPELWKEVAMKYMHWMWDGWGGTQSRPLLEDWALCFRWCPWRLVNNKFVLSSRALWIWEASVWLDCLSGFTGGLLQSRLICCRLHAGLFSGVHTFHLLRYLTTIRGICSDSLYWVGLDGSLIIVYHHSGWGNLKDMDFWPRYQVFYAASKLFISGYR